MKQTKLTKAAIGLLVLIAVPVWLLGCWTLWRLVILGGLCA